MYRLFYYIQIMYTIPWPNAIIAWSPKTEYTVVSDSDLM